MNLARVGLGRALVDSGAYAAAAAAVAAVPDKFVFNQGYSIANNRTVNGVWEYTFNEGRYTIPNAEGDVGIPWIAAADPRVPTLDTKGTGFDNGTELVLQLRDTNQSVPIPLASGIEARLIEAEAALAANSTANFLSFINRARAAYAAVYKVKVPSVSAVPAGMTPVQFLFQERAFNLWLTAHRLGDERREMRQYGFTANQAFPNGPYPKGGVFGNEVALLLPITEQPNPNYAACNGNLP